MAHRKNNNGPVVFLLNKATGLYLSDLIYTRLYLSDLNSLDNIFYISTGLYLSGLILKFMLLKALLSR